MVGNRIGIFFILIGLGLIGLYLLSDVAHSPSCGFLVFGGILLAFGILLWLRNPKPPPQPSGRFRMLKMGQKDQEKKK
ncbi:MAG TPA: hypothetical protein VF806_06900 [Anaerolineaceae bacterium]